MRYNIFVSDEKKKNGTQLRKRATENSRKKKRRRNIEFNYIVHIHSFEMCSFFFLLARPESLCAQNDCHFWLALLPCNTPYLHLISFSSAAAAAAAVVAVTVDITAKYYFHPKWGHFISFIHSFTSRAAANIHSAQCWLFTILLLFLLVSPPSPLLYVLNSIEIARRLFGRTIRSRRRRCVIPNIRNCVASQGRSSLCRWSRVQ